MAGGMPTRSTSSCYKLILSAAQDEFRIDLALIWSALKGRLFNMQRRKVTEVGEKHYDIGNDLYDAMLDKRHDLFLRLLEGRDQSR